MNLAVIGAAGGVGRRVVAQATRAGYAVRGLVRRQEQADMLALYGAEPVLGDLSAGWEPVLSGADAVVWAAGAGAGGNFQAIDGDALIQLVQTLEERGPRRLVAVSSVGVDRPEQMPPFLQAVLRVKAESDGRVQRSALDWTVVRPGGLTDDPGAGQVTVGRSLPGGRTTRDDVAAVVLACLHLPSTVGRTFEVTSGGKSISEALREL
ncbi:SDR family oxidoreductase [Deinococcus aerophilus]|uniref:NAD-dependent dehydratase n=1 Tax=Deinococcus aerophilus TaxID=522488 RepID=A0ABQ2GNN6_9DEIO|nr:SDR family oxidoreductase [Deinococcus aerophilus]GGM04257.1 NAD-dependent dehydratase [Deinococcus aerophilus]